jgi:hypothetical protein
MYRAAAPSIDFYSPDIYWPDFGYWLNRYRALGNLVFVPEARLDAAPWNALYAYGEARGFEFLLSMSIRFQMMDHDRPVVRES